MNLNLVLNVALLVLPIIKDITNIINNKSEERVIEKSITLKTLEKEELIDPLYIVEE